MLTDLAIRSALPSAKPYKLTDGHGLYVEIRPTGAKLWRYRYRIGGRENLFALGAYPAQPVPAAETEAERADRLALGIFTLSEARAAQVRARLLVKQGVHPARERKFARLEKAPGSHPFEAVARAWMAEHGGHWSDRYRYAVEQGFRKNVFPWLGGLEVGDIRPAHVLAVIDRIRKRSPTVAKVTRMWLSGAFRFAILRLMIESDPSQPLQGLIKLPRVRHHRPLAIRHIGGFLNRIDAAAGRPPARAACQLLWLTLVRKNELLNATWEEFDLEAGLWRIPAARMKMREDHVVPLSRQALAILASLRGATGEHPWTFSSHLGFRKALGRAAVHNLFRRIGADMGFATPFTAHGVRSTFSTLANDAGVRSDVIERCLAHQERNATRRAYNRATLLAERRELMQDWADLLDEFRRGGTAVPLALRGHVGR